jgi:hypothetical protein
VVLADDRGDHGLHVPGGQLGQQHLPQVRAQVQADVDGAVAVLVTSQCASQSPTVSIRAPVSPGPGRSQPGQHLQRRLPGRVAAPPDPPAMAAQPSRQLQPHIPALMPLARQQPRARPPVLPAGPRIHTPASPEHRSLTSHDCPPLAHLEAAPLVVGRSLSACGGALRQSRPR